MTMEVGLEAYKAAGVRNGGMGTWTKGCKHSLEAGKDKKTFYNWVSRKNIALATPWF